MAKKKQPRRYSKSKAAKKKTTNGEREKIELFRSFIRANADSYLADKNITSIGIGYKTEVDKKGEPRKKLAVQFSVAQTAMPEELRGANKPIPDKISWRGVEIPTDVVKRSYKPNYLLVQSATKNDRKVRRDPIVPGVSVGNVGTTAGTLGTFVRDRTSGETVILSNWHVLHTSKGEIGDPIVQPGPFDDNRIDANQVGRLLRSHLGVAGDCAIASIEGRKVDTRVMEVDGDVAISRIAEPELGDFVVKSGRTTGVTSGIVTRIDMVTRMEYGDDVVANIGGFEIGPDPDRPADAGEISKGGDSGSVWIARDVNGSPTNVMLGLHFAGDAEGSEGEFALACKASAVFEKLEIEPLTTAAPRTVIIEKTVDRPELRTGFDEHFLDFKVPEPSFVGSAKNDLAVLDGSTRIDYCHFSLWLSKSRKFPRAVAWNVEGGSLRSLSRKGLDFKIDDRGALENHQLDDELYSDNPFDRGHVARRADLCWGPLTEARQANRDSFFFSNITPQHASFNQGMRGGLWGRLEDAIFNDVEVANLRVSLIGGPILRTTDPEYRELAKIPREFWKLVAYKDAADNKPKARAFILTQRDLVKAAVSEILELDKFTWYQVPLSRIESETNIKFTSAFKAIDAMPPSMESLGAQAVRPIQTSSDFFA